MNKQEFHRFEYPPKQMSFSEREKFKNQKILTTMNLLRHSGKTPGDYEVVNNNVSFFTVKFNF